MTNTLPQSQTAVAVGYLRVSTERQATEDRTSLSDQQAAITRKAQALGVGIVRWYRDEGASGATVEGRPAFKAMIAACEASPRGVQSPGFVLVLNDSRWGRFPDPDEAASLRFRLKQSGWLVRFCEGDDSEDVTARSIMRALGAAQASEYRANLRRNAQRGQRGSMRAGFWTREAPFGYRRAVVLPAANARVLDRGALKAPNERVRLTPHAEEAEVVRWAFEQYAGGLESLGGLADKLLARWPGKPWSRGLVQQLLKNRTYTGDIASDAGQHTTEGAHEAIVSRELFEAVQRRLGTNKHRGRICGGERHYLLSGLMRCATCGNPYTGGGNNGWRLEEGVRVRAYSYLDSGKKHGICPGTHGTVSVHLADRALISLVTKAVASPAIRRGMPRLLDELLAEGAGDAGESLAALKASKRRAEQKRERLIVLMADGVLEKHEAAPQIERIRAELADIGARTQAARFGRRRAGAQHADRDRILQSALDFPAVVQKATGTELRDIVRPWLDSVTFDKEARLLTVAIARVPGLTFMPSWRPAPSKQHQGSPHVLIRSTVIGPRRAGGAR